MAAVDKYVRVPLSWLGARWFCDLGMRQVRVLLAMCAMSRMDKATPEGCLKTSMRVMGKEIGMGVATVKDAVDELARRGLVKVVSEGEGRIPATYLLVLPDDAAVENFAFGDYEENPNANGALCSGATRDARTQTPQAVEKFSTTGQDRTQDGVCVRQTRVNAERYTYTPEWVINPKDYPSSGIEGSDLRSGEPGMDCTPPSVPACPRCRSRMSKTNTFLPGGKRREWLCLACGEKAAFADEDLSEPSYSSPRPKSPATGGQDRATAAYE